MVEVVSGAFKEPNKIKKPLFALFGVNLFKPNKTSFGAVAVVLTVSCAAWYKPAVAAYEAVHGACIEYKFCSDENNKRPLHEVKLRHLRSKVARQQHSLS